MTHLSCFLSYEGFSFSRNCVSREAKDQIAVLRGLQSWRFECHNPWSEQMLETSIWNLLTVIIFAVITRLVPILLWEFKQRWSQRQRKRKTKLNNSAINFWREHNRAARIFVHSVVRVGWKCQRNNCSLMNTTWVYTALQIIRFLS